MNDIDIAPEIDDTNRPYWDGLQRGELLYQTCECGHKWMPARRLCPHCLEATWSWRAAKGGGTLLSWVIYHVAYHTAFKDRLPYNVSLVQLDEGPRLLAPVLAPQGALHGNARLELVIDTTANQPLPQFQLARFKKNGDNRHECRSA